MHANISFIKEWKKQVPLHLALPPAGSSFFARVFHPAFNLDAEDAGDPSMVTEYVREIFAYLYILIYNHRR